MDTLFPLLHIAFIHLMMAMVPGPNTVVVGHIGARVSTRAGLGAALGVACASLVLVCVSLAGLGVALAEAGALYRLVQLAGACYLIYVGLRMIGGTAAPGNGPAAPRFGSRSPFAAGFLTTIGNPKSAVFWTGVFALVVPSDAPLWFLCLIAAVVTLQSAAWYGVVALVFSTGMVRRRYLALAAWFDRFAGAVMILLGLKLANQIRLEIAARAV